MKTLLVAIGRTFMFGHALPFAGIVDRRIPPPPDDVTGRAGSRIDIGFSRGNGVGSKILRGANE